jgi:hypothetical protein
MFPQPSQSLEELYSSTRGVFRRKFRLNDCNTLYFSEKELFLEHFEAATHMAVDEAVRWIQFAHEKAHKLDLRTW